MAANVKEILDRAIGVECGRGTATIKTERETVTLTDEDTGKDGFEKMEVFTRGVGITYVRDRANETQFKQLDDYVAAMCKQPEIKREELPPKASEAVRPIRRRSGGRPTAEMIGGAGDLAQGSFGLIASAKRELAKNAQEVEALITRLRQTTDRAEKRELKEQIRGYVPKFINLEALVVSGRDSERRYDRKSIQDLLKGIYAVITDLEVICGDRSASAVDKRLFEDIPLVMHPTDYKTADKMLKILHGLLNAHERELARHPESHYLRTRVAQIQRELKALNIAIEMATEPVDGVFIISETQAASLRVRIKAGLRMCDRMPR